MSGDIDVDGDLADGLRLAWAGARQSNNRHRTGRISWRDKTRAVLVAASLGALGAPPARPPLRRG
ncbi:hypothetical protein I553_2034 [Mycobacterium xenopi 4042]|uniref:Uncharacterized protein n=1 Tax=Mycobacterium xenopi 4042 TaxID=1299334 RepID=X8DLD8_MYCXE|nr:hypothetical protein I553_2034 [Mycobacterium xenopi 4042]